MSGSISAYSYVIRGVEYDMPFMEMIQSVLPIVDEFVIVSDPRFNDGTIEKIISIKDKKINLIEYNMDLNNPGVDGATKQFARSQCKNDYLLQMDSDEVLRKKDYPKLRQLVDYWPDGYSIFGTGVINWFNGNHFKGSAAGWAKERISKKSDDIMHGIPKRSRICNASKCYAKQDTDGAGYINDKGDSLSSDSVLADTARPVTDMIFNRTSIWIHHYSWFSLPRKWEMKATWHYFWGLLYGKYNSLNDYKLNLDGEPVNFWAPAHHKDLSVYKSAIINEMANESIYKPKFIRHEKIMNDWIKRQIVYYPSSKEIKRVAK